MKRHRKAQKDGDRCLVKKIAHKLYLDVNASDLDCDE